MPVRVARLGNMSATRGLAAAVSICQRRLPVPMTTVVTAHRMAFAFSKTRTVLWDQIQYAGSPQDFSWVLPVRGDAKLETAEDAWFSSHSRRSPTRGFRRPSSIASPACEAKIQAVAAAASPPAQTSDGLRKVARRCRGRHRQHEGTVGPYQYVQLWRRARCRSNDGSPTMVTVVPDDVTARRRRLRE